ncbi:CopG family transcriptional regulator [bacterium]|nr:CopG family transcriptional regulator [bacterium]
MEAERVVTVETQVPIQLRKEMQQLVHAGWYTDENELILDALRRFLSVHRTELLTEQIREDVEWGLYGQE